MIARHHDNAMLRDPELDLADAEWDEERRRWKLPKIELVLIGHFLTADLGRVFGRDFYTELFAGGLFNASPVG